MYVRTRSRSCISQARHTRYTSVRPPMKPEHIAFFNSAKLVARAASDSRMYSCVTEVIVTHERVRNENDKPSERRIAVHLHN